MHKYTKENYTQMLKHLKEKNVDNTNEFIIYKINELLDYTCLYSILSIKY